MVGSSQKMTTVREYLTEVAGFNSHVLITGETGTGKELAAAMVHERSPRATHPFVCVNCAAIPETLFESEVFGYEKGVFTGASMKRAGLFAEASGGTLFLDEIGEMPLTAQSKMLRVLESREIQRIGSARSLPIDVRVVAATNQHLEELVGQGKFRSDLFYRLNIARVHLPPLRERKEDIPGLIAYFLGMLNAQMGRQVVGLEPEVHDCLMEYAWPGNVRELKNLMESTLLTIRSSLIGFKDLPAHYQTTFSRVQSKPFQERERLVSALAATHWNISKTAEQLDWARMTVYRKIAQYGIARPCAGAMSQTSNLFVEI
ncbi:MAG: sigma 54-interacting transcriptional regulator [Nitrospirota bacterium]